MNMAQQPTDVVRWLATARTELENDPGRKWVHDQIQFHGFQFLDDYIDKVRAGPKNQPFIELVKTPGRKRDVPKRTRTAVASTTKMKNVVAASEQETRSPTNDMYQALLRAKESADDDDTLHHPISQYPTATTSPRKPNSVTIFSQDEHSEQDIHVSASNEHSQPPQAKTPVSQPQPSIDLSVIAEVDEVLDRSAPTTRSHSKVPSPPNTSALGHIPVVAASKPLFMSRQPSLTDASTSNQEPISISSSRGSEIPFSSSKEASPPRETTPPPAQNTSPPQLRPVAVEPTPAPTRIAQRATHQASTSSFIPAPATLPKKPLSANRPPSMAAFTMTPGAGLGANAGKQRTSWLQRAKETKLDFGKRVSAAPGSSSGDVFAVVAGRSTSGPGATSEEEDVRTGVKRKSGQMAGSSTPAKGGARKSARTDDGRSGAAIAVDEDTEDDDADLDDDLDHEHDEDYVHTFKRALQTVRAHSKSSKSIGGQEAEAAASRARAIEEEEARLKEEEEERQRAEQERIQLEAYTKEEEERLIQEELEKRRREEEQERLRIEEERRLRKEAEAAARAEEEERQRLAAAAEKARREAAEKVRLEEERARQAAAAAKAQREQEAKIRKEVEARERKEAEEKARKEAEEKALKEAEEKALKEEEEARREEARLRELARKAAEAKMRKAAEERARREAEEEARRVAEEKARREEEERLRLKTEEEARQQAQERAHREAQEVARREAEETARRQAEDAAVREAEKKARTEAIRKQSQQAREDAARALARSQEATDGRLSMSDLVPTAISTRLAVNDNLNASGSTTPPDSPPSNRLSQQSKTSKPLVLGSGTVFSKPKPAKQLGTGDGASSRDIFKLPASNVFHNPKPQSEISSQKTKSLSTQSTVDSLASDSIFDKDHGAGPAWVPSTQETESSRNSRAQSQVKFREPSIEGRSSEEVGHHSWQVPPEATETQVWDMMFGGATKDTWSTVSHKGDTAVVRGLLAEDEGEDVQSMGDGDEAMELDNTDEHVPGAFSAESDPGEDWDSDQVDQLDHSESEVDLEAIAAAGQPTIALVKKKPIQESITSSNQGETGTGFFGQVTKFASSVLGGGKKAKPVEPMSSAQLTMAAAKKDQAEKDKKIARAKEMEARRQQVLAKKADEEKARGEEEQRRAREEAEKRKREREDLTDKRPLKLTVKKGGDDDTKKRKLPIPTEKKGPVIKKQPSKDNQIFPPRPPTVTGKPKAGILKQPSTSSLKPAALSGSQLAASSSTKPTTTPMGPPGGKGKGKAKEPEEPAPAKTTQKQMHDRAKAQTGQQQQQQSSSKPKSENIELPDIASEYSDSDDEDRKKFQGPQWAQSPELRAALQQMSTINPDDIFGQIQPLQMEQIFTTRTSRFRARSSSAMWTGTDELTAEEEREYATRMGYR